MKNKILIISTPRTGSYSLLLGISYGMGYPKLSEPFNTTLWKTISPLVYEDTSKVIKTIINQVPSYDLNAIDYYIDFCKNFDTIILLSRKDLKSASESYAHQTKHSKNNVWHLPYSFNKNGIDLDSAYNECNQMNKNLVDLSKKIDIEIDWYEDIYSGNPEKIDYFLKKHSLDLNKEKLLKYINPNKRLRQFKII